MVMNKHMPGCLSQILVNDQKVVKCGALVAGDAAVRLLGEPPKYVSRGGVKLEGALDHFRIDPDGKICLDVGASTGGFTDCLLQRGAARVLAVGSIGRPTAGNTMPARGWGYPS